MARRESADDDDTTRWSTHQTVESEFGQVSRPKELVVDRVTRGNTAGTPSRKPPSTAICCHFEAAKPLLPFQPSISLPF
jgi:hypothetical protein